MGVEAQGAEVLTREQVVDLADAVAEHSGIATGIGSQRFGAQLVVVADDREAAIAAATRLFELAVAAAAIPAAPITRVSAISEDDEDDELA